MLDSDKRPTILVVEDDLANRRLLAQVLAGAGYDVVEAADGEAALDLVRRQDVDAVVMDVGLPGMDGLQVCRRIRADPALLTIPVILVTGRSDVTDLVAGLDAGADDFVTKPYRHPELLARIRSSLRLRRAMAEMEAAHGVVAALANAVEAKDVATENHCERLSSLAYQLGLEVELRGTDLRAVVFGALLHDVGKIGVREAILTKPAALTDDERAEMERHPVIGAGICAPLTSSRYFLPIVRGHHERWDGSGYPDGLKGEQIPIGARIVGLVDAFDAMTHDRPYRAALPLEHAVRELRRNAGRQFDPGLVPLFLARLEASAALPSPRSIVAELAAAS
jgi:putative two-component system response regulator